MEGIDKRIETLEALVAKTSDKVGELEQIVGSKATNKALKSLHTQIMDRITNIEKELGISGE